MGAMDATSPLPPEPPQGRPEEPPVGPDEDFVVVDAAAAGGPSRFELRRGSESGELVGWAAYRREDGAVVIPHVETLVQYRGQGFADRLMAGIVATVRRSGGTIMPLCSFAAGHLRDHPEHADLVVWPHRP